MQWKLRVPALAALFALACAAASPAAWADEGRDRDRDDHGGLSARAKRDLQRVGLDKYVGQFRPANSVAVDGGWTRHTFDPQGGNGPLCILGTPYTAFTKPGNPEKVLVYLNGGGACWKDFYFCSVTADAAPPVPTGIFAPQFSTGTDVIDNPFKDYSVVYGSYCDGSIFAGDNSVADAKVPGGVRHHRGLRNATAVVDLAKATFPNAEKIVVAGSSAGGSGAAIWTPFLARFVFGNDNKLLVFDDAGPVFTNLAETAAVDARASDWGWGQFLPKSCRDCSDHTHFTPVIKWRLQHDRTIREAFYVTDADATLRFFLNVPTQAQFRDLVLATTQAVHDVAPDRYKRFIRSGSSEHTAMRLPLFYTAVIGDASLHQWTADFLRNKRGWVDTVGALVPTP